MSLVTPVDPMPLARFGRVHLVGIGGAGMSGIARILLRRGLWVSGCDARESEALAELGGLGARVHVGHDADHIADVDTVVASAAIRPTVPDIVAARHRGIPVLHRAAALASLMRDRRGVAVTGTHGKTTTTSMLTVALQYCGADPSYVIGGRLLTTGLGADDGRGEIFVAEADESDGSFLMLAPYGVVVTNIEADHLDNYSDLEQIQRSFARFVARVAPGGFLVACADDPRASTLATPARRRGVSVVTYGESPEADLRIVDVVPRGLGSRVKVTGLDFAVEFTLAVPGRHNAGNAAAALAAATCLGHDPVEVAAGLAGFAGTARRFELKGQVEGVRVFDSYAHHPTELAADLRVAAQLVDGGRVIAVFQPHLYSRTRLFAREFGAALELADEVIVLDVYAAREDPEPGVTGELIARAVPQGAAFVPERDVVPELVAATAKPGDIVITMGAGDVTTLGPPILDRLGARQRAGADRGE